MDVKAEVPTMEVQSTTGQASNCGSFSRLDTKTEEEIEFAFKEESETIDLKLENLITEEVVLKDDFGTDNISDDYLATQEILEEILDLTVESDEDLAEIGTVQNSGSQQSIKSRTKIKPFRCDLCPFGSTGKHTLRYHILQVHEKTPIACDECNTKICSKKDFLWHTMPHTECKLCPYRTPNKKHMESHLKIHMKEKSLQCHLCRYTTHSEKLLWRHQGTHSQVKAFKCEACGFETNYQKNLNRHAEIHKSKGFECDWCGTKTFSRKYFLKHVMGHAAGKSFQCASCSFRTNRKSDLVKHLTVHSGRKLFECEICGFTTVYKHSLQHHIRKHIAERTKKLK